MSDEKKKEFTQNDMFALATPFLDKLDVWIHDFKEKLDAAGVPSEDIYYYIGHYLGAANGGVSAVQLAKEALILEKKELSAEEVLNYLDMVMSRASRSSKSGFLSVLIRKYGLDLDVLERAAAVRALESSKPTPPPVDPKDYN